MQARFFRDLPAPLPAPIPHLFSYPYQQTHFLLRVHPFVRDSVVARELRVIAVARRFHLDLGRQFNPIEGAVASCGIGGRAVDRFSLLAPACPSGALAVVPSIRKPGSRSCD